MIRSLFALLAAASLSACVVAEADGVRVAYFGLATGEAARVPPPDETDVIVSDLSVFGLWVEAREDQGVMGAGVGWRDRRAAVAPLDCRMVILVETDEQLAQAEALARELMGEGERLCVSD